MGSLGVRRFISLDVYCVVDWKFGHLEVRKFRRLEVWTFGSLDARNSRSLDIWKSGCVEVWKFRSFKVWMFATCSLEARKFGRNWNMACLEV